MTRVRSRKGMATLAALAAATASLALGAQAPATAAAGAAGAVGGEPSVIVGAIDDAAEAQAAVDAVELVHPDDVRGNLTLPTDGLHDTALAWVSGAPDVVTPTGEVTRPAHGEPAVDVTLTVTATKGAASATRDIVVHVVPAPAPAEYEAYVFPYFAGESTDDGEMIYLGASAGNDPLDYDELNDGDPVLSSTFGTRGLRDPFIIRSPEGDRFYLLATDLKAYPAVDFGEAQETGSKYIEVWESTDLVHWSDQRHVKVSSDFAGNTWAPEAFYDEDAGEYVVYWASALYPSTDTAGRDIGTSYQRMMYATTRDFVTFSEPQPWIDVRRGAGRGMIDATVVEDGGTYYRVVKDEASMTPRQERSTDLRATVSGSLPTTTSSPGWQLVKEKVGVGQPNPWGGTFTNGEGPTIFPDNTVDGRWYMFIDQPSYHGGRGYLAFRTDDISSGDWTSVPSADLPSSPRHGTVIPVTQAELDALRERYQPDLLISDVEDAAVSTREGTAPVLPATVPAVFGDGRAGEVRVDWDEVDPTAYDAPGSFTVAGTVVRGSADDPVATVTVTDEDDPFVSVRSEPDGNAGWWRTVPAAAVVTATDGTGVDRVQTSLDGGPWVGVDGDTTEVAVTGEGEHEVRARAVDVTGNVSAPVVGSVRIDTERPVSRADHDASGTVTIRAADATSGVEHVEYRVDGGAWTTYDGPFAVGEDGADVDYRAVDVAGSVEQANRLVVPAADSHLARTAVVAVLAQDEVRYGAAAVPLSVKVTSAAGTPTGTVRVLVGGLEIASGTLAEGRARLLLDTASDVGSRSIVVRYDGDGRFAHDEDIVVLDVVPALSHTRLDVDEPGPDGRGGLALVRVTTDPRGLPVERVRLRLLRGADLVKQAWVELSAAGRARWQLPRLRAGSWRVVATTPGTSVLDRSTAERRFRVR